MAAVLITLLRVTRVGSASTVLWYKSQRGKGCSGAVVTPTPINLYFPLPTDRSFDILTPACMGGAKKYTPSSSHEEQSKRKAWAGRELPLRERPTEGGEWRGPPTANNGTPRVIFPKKQRSLNTDTLSLEHFQAPLSFLRKKKKS